MPSFTYHAFRYVEVEGLDKKPEKSEIKAVFIRSSFEFIGEFNCDNKRLNDLYALSLRSMECNFTGFPTDCPHREKNGWTGDMQLSASAFVKNYACQTNLYKWIEDICEAQANDGMLPCIVPTSGWGYTWGNGPAWDYALFEIPLTLYKQTGDTVAISKAYTACEKYFEFLTKRANGGLVEMGLGDWNYPKQVEINVCPLELTCSCYYFAMAKALDIFSETLGFCEKKAIYEKTAKKTKQAIRTKYLDGVVEKGVTAIAALMYFGITEEDENKILLQKLVSILETNNYAISYGILGVKYVHNVLCREGRQDVFIKIMERDEYPSFGYWIKNGATTLWEDFEGTNSRNHHMFADIVSVMQEYILGVKVKNVKDPFIEIEPLLSSFNKIEGKLAAPNGELYVLCEKKMGKWQFEVDLPYGVNAELVVLGKRIPLKNGKHIYS